MQNTHALSFGHVLFLQDSSTHASYIIHVPSVPWTFQDNSCLRNSSFGTNYFLSKKRMGMS